MEFQAAQFCNVDIADWSDLGNEHTHSIPRAPIDYMTFRRSAREWYLTHCGA
jgi:hypothetical protein